MPLLRVLLALAMAAGLAPAALAQPAPAHHAAPARPVPPPPGGWLAQVSATADGAMVLGNPHAQWRITEYMSYTCPHCAHFEVEGGPPLRLGAIAPGKAALEVRHFLRDPLDLTVALLTHCASGPAFFALHQSFLARQDEWMARAQSATPAQRQRWENGPLAQRTRAIASDLHFYDIMESRGIERPRADRCLANEALAKQLSAQTARAEQAGVSGTPSFALNGELLAGTHDWATLQLQLNAHM
ncbi:MAG TPA: thioredoxin domain-containing protein [Novosphingobium sp.]|nr:thioredoxin domain-containing protein [Novosphingobium sp.]